MARSKREPEIGLSRLTAYPSSTRVQTASSKLLVWFLLSWHHFDGRFYLYCHVREAHNYDLYSFSATYSPNILQFIHNSTSCNIPLRWDGTRNITPVSIIYHGTLHTNQLILIVHSHCTGMFEKEELFVLLFANGVLLSGFFSRNINAIPYLRPRINARSHENCDYRDDFVVSTTKCAIQS